MTVERRFLVLVDFMLLLLLLGKDGSEMIVIDTWSSTVVESGSELTVP